MIDRLKENAPRFVEKIVAEVRSLGIEDINRWDIDHLCFRTDSPKDYEATKSLFGEISELLVEAPINGRLIATYRLNELLRCGDHSIDVIEVPAPKPGKPYARGLEHLEAVVDIPLQELRDLHPHLSWDDSNVESPVNPDLSLSVGKAVVKFHPMALDCVIEWEKHPFQGVACASEIGRKIAAYKPRISGSIPLGVANERSDVDILCEAPSLDQFESDCKKVFGSEKSFEMHRTQKYGVESAVVNFIVDNVPFQLFAQTLPVEKQVANRHLLIEARLLKLGGNKARRAVSGLKEKGTKTEPAFAQYFGIVGDAYHQLLRLQTLSEKDIRDALRQIPSSH